MANTSNPKGNRAKGRRSGKHKTYYQEQFQRTALNKIRRAKRRQRGLEKALAARLAKAEAYAKARGWSEPGHRPSPPSVQKQA